jgi:hypothetical protein
MPLHCQARRFHLSSFTRGPLVDKHTTLPRFPHQFNEDPVSAPLAMLLQPFSLQIFVFTTATMDVMLNLHRLKYFKNADYVQLSATKALTCNSQRLTVSFAIMTSHFMCW